MVDWPASLPKCAIYDTRSGGYSQATREFRPDLGPPSRRVAASSNQRWFSGTFRMTTAQLLEFWAFYNTTVNKGVDAFTMRDPDFAEDVTVIFDDSAPPTSRTIMRGYHDLDLTFLVIA